MDMKWALNWIHNGFKKVLKHLKFDLLKPAETPITSLWIPNISLHMAADRATSHNDKTHQHILRKFSGPSFQMVLLKKNKSVWNCWIWHYIVFQLWAHCGSCYSFSTTGYPGEPTRVRKPSSRSTRRQRLKSRRRREKCTSNCSPRTASDGQSL